MKDKIIKEIKIWNLLTVIVLTILLILKLLNLMK